MDEILFAVIGRKQVALEEAYQERQKLLTLLHQITTDQVDKSRVTVDLQSGQVDVKPE